jgi:hypothetical protein
MTMRLGAAATMRMAGGVRRSAEVQATGRLIINCYEFDR